MAISARSYPKRTASCLSLSPSWERMVLTLPSKVLYCDSACSLPDCDSLTFSLRVPTSSECFSLTSSNDLRSCVTSARRVSRSFASAFSLSVASPVAGSSEESVSSSCVPLTCRWSFEGDFCESSMSESTSSSERLEDCCHVRIAPRK